MKKIQFFVLGMFVLGIFFVGCNDSNDEVPSNHLKYMDTDYNLSSGYLENYGQFSPDEDYNIDLTLISDGLILYEVNGELDSISGKGHVVYLEAFSSTPTKLENGDYVYDAYSTGLAGTFDMGVILINFDVATEEGTQLEVNGGKLTVTQNGSEYEMSFDFTTTSGNNVTGFFKKSLKYYNYDTEGRAEGSSKKPGWF